MRKLKEENMNEEEKNKKLEEAIKTNQIELIRVGGLVNEKTTEYNELVLKIELLTGAIEKKEERLKDLNKFDEQLELKGIELEKLNQEITIKNEELKLLQEKTNKQYESTRL